MSEAGCGLALYTPSQGPKQPWCAGLAQWRRARHEPGDHPALPNRRACSLIESPLVIVLTTPGIAASFNPLRNRAQEFIDRRFYRGMYDADQTLASFAATARDEVDTERLAGTLPRVLEDTILILLFKPLFRPFSKDKPPSLH